MKIGWDGTLMSSSNNTLHCPLGPGSTSREPLPDDTRTKSRTQSDPSDTQYATAESVTSDSGGNMGECTDGTEMAPHNDTGEHCSPTSDDHSRKTTHRSPKENTNKETNKASTSDDDIDIYSDIESISNDTADDLYGGDIMTMERCEPASPVDQQPMEDSSEDELIIDEEAAVHPESEPDPNSPTKNGLATPDDVSEEEAELTPTEEIDVKNETDDYEDAEIMKEEPASPDPEEEEEVEELGPLMKNEPFNEEGELSDEADELENHSDEIESQVKSEPPTENDDLRNYNNVDALKIGLDDETMKEDNAETPLVVKETVGHVDEDDVISAKVGSPISESEEPNEALRRDLHNVTTESVEENPSQEMPEEGELNADEIIEEDEKPSDCYSKLEGVEDVSEAGSEDEKELEEDEKQDDEDGEEDEKDGVEDESVQDVDIDDIEAKVAQLFDEESKQQQSEEEEGLCESDHDNSPEEISEVAVPTKKFSSYHSSVEHTRTSHRSREHASDCGGRRSESEINWKKPSKNTKERSYRDGKLRDERILYRERELKDKSIDEKSSRKKEDGGCRHTRKEEDRSSSSRYDKRSNTKSNKYKENKYDTGSSSSHAKRHRNDYEWHDKQKWYDKRSSSEKRVSERNERHRGEKCASSSKHKHKDYKYDQYGSKFENSEKQYKYEQPVQQMSDEVAVDKRRREKRKEREVRKVENKIIVEKSSKDKKRTSSSQSKKKKRSPSPVSEVSDVESKEIYSKGGSIIINVNYNRSKEGSGKHPSRKPSSSKQSNTEAKPPIVVHNDDSDSWAAADAKDKSSWDDDEIQILCEKQAPRREKHTNPAPVPSKRKQKDDSKQTSNKVNAFDMFWRDVEDISQDAKTQQDSELKENVPSEENIQEEMTPTKEQQDSILSNKQSPSIQGDKSSSAADNLSFSGIFKRQPRSPSPPSPSDDESYDPCDPTCSPSPRSEDKKEMPISDPKPPPEPIRPPLPLEPEPRQPSPPPPLKATFESPPINNSTAIQQQHPFVNTGPSTLIQSGPMAMPNIRIPPPNFMQQAMVRNPGGLVAAGIQTLRPWPMANGPPPMIFQSSQMQHLIRGNFMGPGGLQPSQMGGMMPGPPGGNHLAMIRAPLGGPSLLPTPSVSAGGPMLLPDLSHPPPSLVMQPAFSVGGSVVPNSTTVVTSVPLLVPIMTVTSGYCKPHDAIKEGSDAVVDMEVESPYSPADSPSVDNADEPSLEVPEKRPSTPPKDKNRFDALLEAVPRLLADKKTRELLAVLRPKIGGFKTEKRSSVAAATSTTVTKADSRTKHRHKLAGKRKGIAVKMKESQLKILDELPSSAVEMQVKEKFLKKLNRQERVVEEVKHALKPFYNKRDIDKSEYKSILRKCVPKICHNKTGEINPVKIKGMVEGYVRKYKHHHKKSHQTDS